MPAPVILFYTPAPAGYAPSLLRLCAVQGIRLRVLESGDLGRTLAVLARGLKPQEPLSGREPLPEPMLIFCHFSDRQLDRILSSLRKLRISCLKAVLTPTNASWTPEQLYRELCRERSQLGGVHGPENDK